MASMVGDIEPMYAECEIQNARQLFQDSNVQSIDTSRMRSATVTIQYY